MDEQGKDGILSQDEKVCYVFMERLLNAALEERIEWGERSTEVVCYAKLGHSVNSLMTEEQVEHV